MRFLFLLVPPAFFVGAAFLADLPAVFDGVLAMVSFVVSGMLSNNIMYYDIVLYRIAFGLLPCRVFYYFT